ncbi:hypothetical protein ACOI9V_08135 [Corynebacterium striatum]|uniref:hypothetical protein n=1 Tax=Corynebacterium striatum TaxID=43770 RepID=UPI003B5C5334
MATKTVFVTPTSSIAAASSSDAASTPRASVSRATSPAEAGRGVRTAPQLTVQTVAPVGDDVVNVEIATFEWVNWWNESRLHQSVDYHTLAEVEAEFWEHHPSQEIMEIKANA